MWRFTHARWGAWGKTGPVTSPWLVWLEDSAPAQVRSTRAECCRAPTGLGAGWGYCGTWEATPLSCLLMFMLCCSWRAVLATLAQQGTKSVGGKLTEALFRGRAPLWHYHSIRPQGPGAHVWHVRCQPRCSAFSPYRVGLPRGVLLAFLFGGLLPCACISFVPGQDSASGDKRALVNYPWLSLE